MSERERQPEASSVREPKCRHRESWIIASRDSGTALEWCYQCGAIRKHADSGVDGMWPITGWCKPTGPDGNNPWDAWQKRAATYRKRNGIVVHTI
jgi:hypothetical protein